MPAYTTVYCGNCGSALTPQGPVLMCTTCRTSPRYADLGGGRYYAPHAPDPLGLACDHGMLARACEVCELEREVAELRARLPVWLPIETAPKDGTWLLLWDSGLVIIEIGRWAKLLNYWMGDDGERSIPSHWMPLPEPPKPEDTDRAGSAE